MSKSLTITDDKVREAIRECPESADVLKTLFPGAVEEPEAKVRDAQCIGCADWVQYVVVFKNGRIVPVLRMGPVIITHTTSWCGGSGDALYWDTSNYPVGVHLYHDLARTKRQKGDGHQNALDAVRDAINVYEEENGGELLD